MPVKLVPVETTLLLYTLVLSAAADAIRHLIVKHCSRLQSGTCCCRSSQTACSWAIVRRLIPRSASSVRLFVGQLTVCGYLHSPTFHRQCASLLTAGDAPLWYHLQATSTSHTTRATSTVTLVSLSGRLAPVYYGLCLLTPAHAPVDQPWIDIMVNVLSPHILQASCLKRRAWCHT